MEKEVLRSLVGAGIYPVISLIIFFVFFIGTVIFAFKSDKKYIAKMSSLPLEDSDEK
jgi:cytochrome c oxidase cbb3-type subunit 3